MHLSSLIQWWTEGGGVDISTPLSVSREVCLRVCMGGCVRLLSCSPVLQLHFDALLGEFSRSWWRGRRNRGPRGVVKAGI